MRGKEFATSKSPEIIGVKTPPTSPQKSPPGSVDRKKTSPAIPTYVQVKKRLREALLEIERLKGESGQTFSGENFNKAALEAHRHRGLTIDKFKTPKATRSNKPLAPPKSPKSSSSRVVEPAKAEDPFKTSELIGRSPEAVPPPSQQPANQEQSEISPVKSEGTDQDGDVKARDVFQAMLMETVEAFLRSGVVFNKIGRNGKIYQRIVRWSKDMKSVEWVKALGESPRYVLMNSINNAKAAISTDQHGDEICNLSSDHRSLSLVLENNSQRHWAEVTAQVVKHRSSIAAYLESISKQL